VFVGTVLLLGLASAVRLFPWTSAMIWDLRSMVELSFLSAITLSLFVLRPLSPRISQMMLWHPIAALGTISYSLYLIHQFNLTLVASIAQRVLPTGMPRFVIIVTMLGLHIALATLFWFLCERPFLSRKPVSSPSLAAGNAAAGAA
jgi:peptidoglycan/LPS O-acetylase OafA/YrhL